MPVIYLIRHGQTDWNATERLQGQADTPLNDKGRAQAKRNGAVLRGLLGNPSAFDYVSSPLLRTRHTMEIVRGQLGLPPDGYKTDPRVMEINFGRWQGSTWDELRAQDAAVMEARFADPWNTVAPGEGGESFAMVQARALQWFDGVSRDSIVVTHGGIHRVICAKLQNLPGNEAAQMKVRQDRILVIDAERKVSWV
ncbi:MAG: histidine phosphatase family protein [Pseudomonadota bacterium]|nr:histidine phosphatase family protein [Pseudomonadota bacterium]